MRLMSRSGILLIDKPPGITSRKVVDRVLSRFDNTKIGHAGTLDPLANGLLVLCLGSATKLIKYIQDQEKVYEAVIILGATSETDDAEGVITKTNPCPCPTRKEAIKALDGFKGEIEQIPPRYSAIKVGGRRSYKLARSGEEVALEPRKINIKDITLLDYQFPTMQIKTTVGKGTYIRSLARDIGKKLGTGGFLSDLRRAKIGSFSVEEAISANDIDLLPKEAIDNLLLPSIDAVPNLPKLAIHEMELLRIRRGQAINPAVAISLPTGELALTLAGKLVAIGKKEKRAAMIKPILVLQD